jgi:hypothetical protein
MKKTVVCLSFILLAASALPADDSDVIAQARNEATEDGRSLHPFWWGVGGAATAVMPVVMTAFCADAIPVEARRAIALTVPVLGGAGLSLLGYSVGKTAVPDARMAAIQGMYGDSRLQALYESEYVKTVTKIQRRKQGNSVLIGFGATVGAMGIGFLVVSLTK